VTNQRAWIGLWVLFTLIVAPDRSSFHAQARAAIVESVNLLIPMAPTTVAIMGKTHVVYELHMTNLLPVDVSVTRIQVKRDGALGESIADYRAGDLSTRIGRPGLRRAEENPQIVGPGLRTVAYFWIELPEGAVVPNVISHRIELDVMLQAGPVHVAVDGARSVVSKELAVALDPPLRGGPWVAIYDPLLKGGHRTAMYTVDGRARIPARFAIDWVRLPASGAMERHAAPGPADWTGYGSEVLAVADGVVAAALDDIADNVASPSGATASIPIENESGNYVALDLGRERFAVYEHLKHGSIAVKAGDRIKRGQVVGRLGNSGSSSIGPHLHFHVSDASSPLAAEGLPFVFKSFDRVGAFPSIAALVAGESWLAHAGQGVNPRKLERPGPNTVIQFP
jgi:murein DD-endopeptidase MepM/ murein hydrolase activator NlpD